uniref:CD1e molecule n=1 Tax=Macaca fascicularis TaxID=9541 RepID=A0A7N9DB66_MACFA
MTFRLVPGREFLPSVSVFVSDFGERKLAPEEKHTCKLPNYLSSLSSFFSFGITFPIPLHSLYLSFPSLSAPQALQSYRPAAEDPLSFRMLQISSFANHSWAHSEGSGWLGDLQTHGWDTVTGTIRFLKPWSHGNFSKQELKNLQSLFQLYFNGFVRIVQASAGQFQLEYPFEIQILAGCRMNAPQIFLNMAYQGSDFLSFQGISWEPSPGAGIRAQNVCKVLSRYLDIKEILQSLLGHTCPRFLAGLMEAGESELKRKVKPEAWLSRGPSPGPGRLQLVCHVSGFYPKPVWVMWMRGEQEQRGTQRGDILPNADETWYLRATLDVATGEAAGLSCRVKHSSIEGHDLIIHWGEKELRLCWEIMKIALGLLRVGAEEMGRNARHKKGKTGTMKIKDRV